MYYCERIKKVKIPLRDAMDETFINFPTKNQTTTDKATSIGKNAAKFQAREFIDYALVCEILENEFNKNKFVKVEDALNYFCDFFKKKYPTINYFFMKIIKKEILQNADVGAMIEEIF